MKFGLEQHIIDKLIAVLEQNLKVDKAFVFGSRAKGNYRTDSDIDIALKGQDLNTDDIIALSVAFEEKGVTHKIDLLNYDTIKEPDLKDHIDRVGIELYSRWKELSLSEITEPVKDTYNPDGSNDFTYIGLEHIEQETLRLNSVGTSSDVTSNKFKFQSNDVLFGKLRPYFRKVVKPQFEGICSTDIWVFRAKQGFDQEFLFYFLANKEFVDTANSGESGSRMPRADWNHLKATNWNIPPLKEQTAIASILSSLDDKIDLLHRQNKTLEQLAETLFRQWFVEEAEESWEEKSFSDLIETTLGGEWGKENPEGEYQLRVQCIRGTDIADLETGIPMRTPIRFIKQKKFESIEIKDGDLTMEISGGTDNQSTGRTAYINEEVKAIFKLPLVFSNFCRLIRPKKKEYSFFLHSYIHHLYKQGDLFNLENGSSGIKNLNYKALLFDLQYKIPNEKAIIKFNTDVELYYYKINKNKHQILTLSQTRDNLLPKLMSGEVRVKMSEHD